jgi:hypothetical protein
MPLFSYPVNDNVPEVLQLAQRTRILKYGKVVVGSLVVMNGFAFLLGLKRTNGNRRVFGIARGILRLVGETTII